MADYSREKINKVLGRAGLAQLSEPMALFDQLAMGIRTHKDFLDVLRKVEADKRPICYQSLAPRLGFKAKPLDVYVAELGQEAERMKLPIYNHETAMLTPFKVAEIGEKKPVIEQVAEQSIAAEEARMRFDLVCRKCTREQVIFADDDAAADKLAEAFGWKREVTGKALCPKCGAN